jgi:hypothetical protein
MPSTSPDGAARHPPIDPRDDSLRCGGNRDVWRTCRGTLGPTRWIQEGSYGRGGRREDGEVQSEKASRDYVTLAWTKHPVEDVLQRVAQR